MWKSLREVSWLFKQGSTTSKLALSGELQYESCQGWNHDDDQRAITDWLVCASSTEEKAAHKEIKKAYRQKAFSCHPGKNPDNLRAGELFSQLSQALQVLTDAASRVVYDKIRKAKKHTAERTQKLDERRKKIKLTTPQMSSSGFFKSMEKCST